MSRSIERHPPEWKYRGFTTKCKRLFTHKNKKCRLDFARKYLSTTLKKKTKNKETQGQVFTDECKINFCQNVEKRKVWGRRETTHDPMHITSVKHGGGGVMS